MKPYYRPIPSSDIARPLQSHSLAGGWTWFEQVEILKRGSVPEIVSADEIPPDMLRRLTAHRATVCGQDMGRPRLMGILNVTPDSFSDGGEHEAFAAAVARARVMALQAEIIDIGGESTRPGATEVPVEEEISRTAPVIAALRAAGMETPISIDTRKAAVAEAALAAGATMINDVSALAFDPAVAPLAAASRVPICLMHASGLPETMQDDPRYSDVLLDVYDALEERISAAEAAGIPRELIVIDPGIGFGKTGAHNLAVLARISLFHGLGCPVLLGVSRKRFIGTYGAAVDPRDRVPGSLAVGMAAVAQGVQILRVHDTEETLQALRLHMAATTGCEPEDEG